MTDQIPDAPLDLGPIDPGERQEWVPGLSRPHDDECDCLTCNPQR